MAGEGCLQLFLHRNPELSISKAESVCQARAQVSRSDVTKYFELLGEVLLPHGLINKPDSVYNIDETGLQINNRPEKVIDAKGSKMVANNTSGE